MGITPQIDCTIKNSGLSNYDYLYIFFLLFIMYIPFSSLLFPFMFHFQFSILICKFQKLNEVLTSNIYNQKVLQHGYKIYFII